MAKALYSLTSLSSYISLLLCNVLLVLSVAPFLYNDQNHLPTIVDYGPYWLNLIKMDGFPSFVKANFTATLIQFLESGRYYTHIFLAFYVDCSSFLGKLRHSLWVAYWFPVLIVWLIVSPQIRLFLPRLIDCFIQATSSYPTSQQSSPDPCMKVSLDSIINNIRIIIK